MDINYDKETGKLTVNTSVASEMTLSMIEANLSQSKQQLEQAQNMVDYYTNLRSEALKVISGVIN